MARQRDYKAEYQRRLQRGTERGLSSSQARGHARQGELPVRELTRRGDLPAPRDPAIERVYRVYNRMQQGESLGKASNAESISPSTVKTYNQQLGLFGKTYKKEYQPGKQPAFAGWFTGGDRPHFPIITSDGGYLPEVPFDQMHASIMGKYWNAVQKAFEGKTAALQQFAGVTVYDLNGNKYQLATDINLISLVIQSMSDEQQQNLDRNFYQRKGMQRATQAIA